MKHLRVILVLIVISCLGLMLLLSRNSPGRLTRTRPAPSTPNAMPNPPAEKDSAEIPKSERGLVSVVSARKAKSAPDPVVESRNYKAPLIRFIGDGTSGKVVGPDGRTLMASGNGIGIFGASVAADQKQVLIRAGGGINFVMDSVTGDKVQLPLTPPGHDMMGFETWYWVNDQKLLGVSGIEAHDTETAPSDHCPEPHASQTKLYLYDVPTKQLREIAFSDEDLGLVFSVTEVSHDGSIHIFGDGRKEGGSRDLGWFRVD